MLLALGYIALLVGFAFRYWFGKNLNALPSHKPLAFYSSSFIFGGTIFWILSIIGGIALIFYASLEAGIYTLGTLIVIWLVIQYFTTKAYTTETILKAYWRLSKQYPNEPLNNIYFMILKARHPDWPDEFIHSFVADYTNAVEFASGIFEFEKSRKKRKGRENSWPF